MYQKEVVLDHHSYYLKHVLIHLVIILKILEVIEVNHLVNNVIVVMIMIMILLVQQILKKLIVIIILLYQIIILLLISVF